MQAMAAQAKTHPSPTRSTVKTQENIMIMIMIMDSTAQHLRKSITSIMKFSQIDESPSMK
jgi:ABC-type polysaccharide/polyol phosphate transport system ATPase subunit